MVAWSLVLKLCDRYFKTLKQVDLKAHGSLAGFHEGREVIVGLANFGGDLVIIEFVNGSANIILSVNGASQPRVGIIQ